MSVTTHKLPDPSSVQLDIRRFLLAKTQERVLEHITEIVAAGSNVEQSVALDQIDMYIEFWKKIKESLNLR